MQVCHLSTRCILQQTLIVHVKTLLMSLAFCYIYYKRTLAKIHGYNYACT